MKRTPRCRCRRDTPPNSHAKLRVLLVHFQVCNPTLISATYRVTCRIAAAVLSS